MLVWEEDEMIKPVIKPAVRTAESVIKDIRKHPENHKHDYDGLIACCMINGAIDCRVMDVHSEISTRSNGGVRCDVTSGPCSCGAWHFSH